MTPTNVFFMVAIPLALMGIIGLVLLSGRLAPRTRRRMEWTFIVVFYPAMTVLFGWRAIQSALTAEWLMAAISGFLCGTMAFQGVALVRKRRRADGTRT